MGSVAATVAGLARRVRRWRWARLGSPQMLVAVLALAANDHVLKQRWPGVVTGKLSDVAGVAMVAIAASVAVPWRVAAVCTAIGFTALKIVPGVAEAVAPLLGGTTRRDWSDLAALVVLLPVAVGRRVVRPAVVGGSVWLAAIGAAGLVAVTTATSCDGPRGIARVEVRGDGTMLVGERGDRAAATQTWMSTDGGQNWVTTAASVEGDRTRACAGETCFSLGPGHTLRRCGSGVCGVIYEISDDDAAALRRRDDVCGSAAGFVAVDAALVGTVPVAVVAMGTQGVLVVSGDTIKRVAVGQYAPLSPEADWIDLVPLPIVFVGGLLVGLYRTGSAWRRLGYVLLVWLLGAVPVGAALVDRAVGSGTPSGWWLSVICLLIVGLVGAAARDASGNLAARAASPRSEQNLSEPVGNSSARADRAR